MSEAAGCISLAEEALRKTLADSATFRTLVGAADRNAALGRIFTDGLPKPADGALLHSLAELQAYRPYAILYTAEQNGFTRTHEAGGAEFEFDQSGQIVLRIVQNSPESHDSEPTAPANRDFKNTLGQIIDEMCDLAGSSSDTAGDYLAFHRIGLSEGPYWGHPKTSDTQGIWQGADLLVQWQS